MLLGYEGAAGICRMFFFFLRVLQAANMLQHQGPVKSSMGTSTPKSIGAGHLLKACIRTTLGPVQP